MCVYMGINTHTCVHTHKETMTEQRKTVSWLLKQDIWHRGALIIILSYLLLNIFEISIIKVVY